jgi:hypothetical protein
MWPRSPAELFSRYGLPGVNRQLDQEGNLLGSGCTVDPSTEALRSVPRTAITPKGPDRPSITVLIPGTMPRSPWVSDPKRRGSASTAAKSPARSRAAPQVFLTKPSIWMRSWAHCDASGRARRFSRGRGRGATPLRREPKGGRERGSPDCRTTYDSRVRGLQALAEGLDSQGVADRLHISVRTERNHVASILTKLGVHSRLQALVFVLRAGAVEIK